MIQTVWKIKHTQYKKGLTLKVNTSKVDAICLNYLKLEINQKDISLYRMYKIIQFYRTTFDTINSTKTNNSLIEKYKSTKKEINWFRNLILKFKHATQTIDKFEIL